jgi:hemerythrin
MIYAAEAGSRAEKTMEQGRSRAEDGTVLDELDRYTAVHFSHEEECMFRYECPAAQLNAREHREFLRIVGQVPGGFRGSGSDHEARPASSGPAGAVAGDPH